MTLNVDALINPLDAALRAAAAAEVTPRFRKLHDEDVGRKSRPDDLVTVADTAAEAHLRDAVRRIAPDAAFMGEEGVAADPSTRRFITDADLVVVVDPIDGTWPFANGMPTYGMILAVIARGETVAGIINLPSVGASYIAVRGAGARRRDASGEESSLQVPPPPPLAETVGLIAYTMFDAEARGRLAAASARTARCAQIMCSAWDYALLAEGRAHFALNGGLEPWDHAAGVLLHSEAGGFSRVLQGEDVAPYRPAMREGRLLLAADIDAWKEVKSLFLS